MEEGVEKQSIQASLPYKEARTHKKEGGVKGGKELEPRPISKHLKQATMQKVEIQNAFSDETTLPKGILKFLQAKLLPTLP